MRRRLARALFVLSLVATGQVHLVYAGAPPAGHGALAVITSRQTIIPDFSRVLLRDIFLKKVVLTSEGREYIPVNLPPMNPLRKAFNKNVIHMDTQQSELFWDKAYFAGTSPPYVLDSERAVLRFVAKEHGAIGYVRACFVTPEIKVLKLIPLAVLPLGHPLTACPSK